MSEKEIRDLDVSEEEGEDVKGGTKGPMPPAHNPGKPSIKSPGNRDRKSSRNGGSEVTGEATPGPTTPKLIHLCGITPGSKPGTERRASECPPLSVSWVNALLAKPARAPKLCLQPPRARRRLATCTLRTAVISSKSERVPLR